MKCCWQLKARHLSGPTEGLIGVSLGKPDSLIRAMPMNLENLNILFLRAAGAGKAVDKKGRRSIGGF